MYVKYGGNVVVIWWHGGYFTVYFAYEIWWYYGGNMGKILFWSSGRPIAFTDLFFLCVSFIRSRYATGTLTPVGDAPTLIVRVGELPRRIESDCSDVLLYNLTYIKKYIEYSV